MKNFIIQIIITLSASLTFAASVDDIRWLAQDYPPYIYIDENGQNYGPVADFVGELMKKTGSSKTKNDIAISNFTKMFVYSNNDENTVFFPLARTKDRESHFKWVGPIFTNEPVIFAKSVRRSTDKGLTGRKPITIKTIDDLKSYSILGREKYTGVIQLQQADINVDTGDSDTENFLKLKDDKVQMVVCDKTVGNYLLKKLGLDAQDYEVVYKLDTNEMSFAFNKDTDDDLINLIADNIKTIKLKPIK